MDKKVLLFDIIKLFAIYSICWLILSGGLYDWFSFLFIMLFAIITPMVFILSFPIVNFKNLLKLLYYFAINSLKSGFLVGTLAIKKDLNLRPSIYKTKLKTKTPFASSILANMYSLMPGTLSMGLYGDELILHIIDESLFDEDQIKLTEQKVIDAFEVNL